MATLDEMNDWNELAAQQRANRESEEMAQNQQLFDQFGAIEQNAKQQAMLRDRQRAIAGAAMMESAYKNGGMSDRSLGEAFSQAFGRPVLGGQIVDLGEGRGRGFVIYGAAKDEQGNATVAPVAMMDGSQMMRVLQRAGLGDRTAGLQKELYGDLSSRLTADQIGKMGIRNPSAPISTGGAVISAAGMRALRGTPRQRSTISVFSNIGGDGYAGTGTRSATIRPDGTREEVTTGSRREDAPGKWKVLESNADGQRYANDKTGEEVFVPKGDSLRNVLQRGGSERERIAQMNNESRERRAQIAADATTYKANAAKEIAGIRARATGKKDGFKVSDLKILKDIANDPMADEELRNAAKELMGTAIDQLSGGTAQPKKGGDASTQGGTAPSAQETREATPEEIAAARKALESRRVGKQPSQGDGKKGTPAKPTTPDSAERQRRLDNGRRLSGLDDGVYRGKPRVAPAFTKGSPEWHIDKIEKDKSLSQKSKEARIAYWRRRQEEAAKKDAEELGIDANDDLAMLEAELNGRKLDGTMIAKK